MTNALPVFAISLETCGFEDIKKAVMEDCDVSDLQTDRFQAKADGHLVSFELRSLGIVPADFVVMAVDSMTQEGVGAAWNLLVSVFYQHPGQVWVSTYTREHLAQYGELREIQIDHTTGFLMKSESFDRMLS